MSGGGRRSIGVIGRMLGIIGLFLLQFTCTLQSMVSQHDDFMKVFICIEAPRPSLSFVIVYIPFSDIHEPIGGKIHPDINSKSLFIVSIVIIHGLQWLKLMPEVAYFQLSPFHSTCSQRLQ